MIKNFIEKNITHILTGVGVIGIAATAYLSGKAVMNADVILAMHMHKEAERQGEDFTETNMAEWDKKYFPFKKKIKLTWQCYIPPVLCGLATAGVFIGAHVIDTKRLTAMTEAYILSKEAFARYREEVKEEFGSEAEQIIDERSKEAHKDEMPFDRRKTMTFMEPVTRQTFTATPQDIIFAEAKINRLFQNNMCCSYAQFLKLLGLKVPADIKANKIGWWLDDSYSYNSSFFGNWIGIDFYKPLEVPYCELTFTHEPMEPDEPDEWNDYQNWERC